MLMALEAALDAVMRGLEPLREREAVPLRELAGRVVAADLVARRTQPDFDASAMDGYAVRSADTGAGIALRLVGESAAGSGFTGRVEPGECVRIFTGAPMPAGADAVVIQEDVARDGASVRLSDVTTPQRHVRPRGNDFGEGMRLVPAGAVLRPASIALAASGGYPTVEVLRRPRVGLLATGDELVRPGEPVAPTQIVASNTYGIAAIAEAAGAVVTDLGIVGDREDLVANALAEALAGPFDILVTIGGASVGDHDLVGPALARRGVQLDVMKVAMRPGKPLMAGRGERMRVLGLPGNPASSLVTAIVFLAPMIRRLAGHDDGLGRRSGTLARNLPANDHRAEFMRARLTRADGTYRVDPLERQDSSLLSVFAAADALLFRPAHAPAASVGEPCDFYMLDGGLAEHKRNR